MEYTVSTEHTVSSFNNEVARLYEAVDADGICRAEVDEEQLRGISTYSGQQLEVDWKSETRRLCDVTFRAALCIHYAGL